MSWRLMLVMHMRIESDDPLQYLISLVGNLVAEPFTRSLASKACRLVMCIDGYMLVTYRTYFVR